LITVKYDCKELFYSMQAFFEYWSFIVMDWHKIVIKLASLRGVERRERYSFEPVIGQIVIVLLIS
jgi:hypothetical protein